jgi:hypothetical protein
MTIAMMLLGPVALIYPEKFNRTISKMGIKQKVQSWKSALAKAEPARPKVQKRQFAAALEIYAVPDSKDVEMKVAELYRLRAERAEQYSLH